MRARRHGMWLVGTLLVAAPAPGVDRDHLECLRITDPLARAVYRADLDGLAAERACTLRTPARTLCVPASARNLTPPPPGAGQASGAAAGTFACYATRCSRTPLPAVPVSDAFGTRAVTPSRPKLLCAPATSGPAPLLESAEAPPDHLECYAVKDRLAATAFGADVAALAAERGCTVRTPARLLCVPSSKTNVNPSPPGGGPTDVIPGSFACYRARCPRSAPATVPIGDQFGTRSVAPHRTRLLCAPMASEWALDAGSLRLQVDENPWRLRFFDRDGNLVLEEHGGTTAAPTGTLGLHLGPPPAGDGQTAVLPPVVDDQPQVPPERATGWIHATRVLESHYEAGAWVATVATNDPTGRTLLVRAEAESDGVIALTATPSVATGVQAAGIAFVAAADERFLGFGERSNRVDQHGRAVEHYVGEGPYQDEEYPGIQAVVPKWGIRWRDDATYFPIPWLLSSRGYGVLLDNDVLSYHRLASEALDAWSMEAEEPVLRFRVFGGPAPADALRRFTRATGRQPRRYAPWFFGPWVQQDTDDRIRALREADVPTSLAATYLHYLPCGAQQGQEDAQRQRTAALHAQGTAVHTYFNPMICTDYQPAYDQARAADALLEDRTGADYVFPYTTTQVFTVSEFEFTSPASRDFYGQLLREALAHGYEGWMEDFGEYVPLDAVSADGATGTRLHNRHARDYHCGAQTALAGVTQPLARFVRSGWTGSAACSPIVWGGDPTTSFGFDGLESSIYQALSMGTSGVGIWGSDIGGFFALGFRSLSDENLDRWIQLGAFSPVMRTQANGIALPPKTRPQVWDPDHLPLWRRYAKLHTQLWPYVQAAAEEYYATGMPIMRHGALTHPGDATAVARDDQYMFGPDLLVAPVYMDGARSRTLYAPAGTWVDWWRSVAYAEADGGLRLQGATLVDGGRLVTLAAPLDEIPVLVRAGSMIAMLSPDVHTLAEHGTDPAIVHLSDRADRLHVLAFPRGTSQSAFHVGESLTSAEGSDGWRLTVDGAREYAIELEAALGALAVPLVPCSVTVDAGMLDGWTYEAGARVLRATFRTRAGTLTVRGGTCGP